MKNAGDNAPIKGPNTEKEALQVSIHSLQQEVEHYKKEKDILMALGSDLTRARDKNDLLLLFSKRIKGLFYFTHTVVTLIDYKDVTYTPFLLDTESSPIRSHPDYQELTTAHFPLGEPFIQSVLQSDDPVSFLLEDVITKPGSPAFLRANYESGIKEALMTRLMNEGKPFGFLHIHSDKPGSFSNEFRNVIKGIAPQLSGSVTNIIKNEGLLNKEKEKSFLLDFSSEIATVRTKEELASAVRTAINKLNQKSGFVIRRINEDNTISPYVFDLGIKEHDQNIVNALQHARYPINDGLQNRVLDSIIPLLFNVDREIQRGIPAPYLQSWKAMGFKNFLGIRLRNGETNHGIMFLDIEDIRIELLQGICAQISIALANIIANEKLLAYKKQLEVENDYLKEQISTIYNFSEIIGSGGQMQQVYRLMSLVADSNATVLVSGETGTGKELIARAIHNASPRKDKLMVKVNCAALPVNLIESELFGHEKGAFTGAIDRRIGKFELANNSTLFLDEVGELPLEAQAKLLRVIQERELERIGGKQTIKIDVRLIAATNRNLEEEVKAGRFRADLYFRLNVFPINLPPLRDRLEDIEPLTHFFVEKYSRSIGRKIRKVAPKVINQLRSYTWPGNVRELEYLIERSVLLATNSTLDDVFIPRQTDAEKQDQAYLLNRSLEEVERDYIIDTLKRCAGKISGPGSAAEILKIPGNTLHSKMKKLGINKSDYFA
jgi:transcriptional regulator with GAF, ATPase, and Fis domain